MNSRLPRRFTFLTLTSLLFTLLPSVIRGEDWPMLGRDHTRNAVSPENNPPVNWEVGKFDRNAGKWTGSRNIKWTARLGSACIAQPVVSNGLVWIGSNNQNPSFPDSKTDMATLLCFRERDGELLYRSAAPRLAGGIPVDYPYSPIGCSPLIEEDRLWFFNSHGQIVCWNIGPLRCGKKEPAELWKFDLRKELGVHVHAGIMFFERRCSIASHQDWIYVITNNGVKYPSNVIPNPEAPTLVCFEKKTGKVVWTDNSPGKNILRSQPASPLVIEVAGRAQVIVPMGDGWLRSFDPRGDGKGGSVLLWKFDMNRKESRWLIGGRGNRNQILSTPVFYKGRVYLASGQQPDNLDGPGRLVCLDPTKCGDISSELAVDAEGNPLPQRRHQAVDTKKGEKATKNPNSGLVWEYTGRDQNGNGKIEFEERFRRTVSNVAIKDGLVVATDLGGLIHCFDADTGKRHWYYDTFSLIHTSPLIVDDKIYVCDEDGDVAIFNLSEEQHEPLDELYMNSFVYSSPIFANGTLYVASRSHLFAIQADDKEEADDKRKLTLAREPGFWPQWRGPNQDNISSGTGLLKEWPKDGPPLLWKAEDLGQGFPSVAVADGRVFLVGYQEESEHLIALDELTGQKLWDTEIKTGRAGGGGMSVMNQRTPTVDDDRLYFVTRNGRLICLDTSNGRLNWQRFFEEEFSGTRGFFGYGTFPLVDGERLICTPGGEESPIVAIDKRTGKTIWKSRSMPVKRPGHSGIVVAEVGGVRQYIQNFSAGTVSVAADDGRFLWHYDRLNDFRGNAHTPIVRGDRVLCTNGWGKGIGLLKLSRKGRGIKTEEVYFSRAPLDHWLNSSVAVANYLYLCSFRGQVLCYNIDSGELVWAGESPVGPRPRMTYADGHLYLHGIDGSAALVEANPQEYVEKSVAEFADHHRGSFTFPVVTGGRLYLRRWDTLYCYDVTEDSSHSGSHKSSAATSTGFWPQWRGPKRDNVSTETGLLDRWPKQGPPLAREISGIGEGIGSIALAGGKVFTLGYIGESEYVTALDERTGQRVWAARIGPAVPENSSMRWLSQRTPTVDGERLYAFTSRGELICLATADGEELWRKSYIKDFGAKEHFWGLCDYPLVDGDRLICAPGGSKATLVALNKATGEVIWQAKFDAKDDWSGIVVTEGAGVRQYVVYLGKKLCSVAAKDGRLLWTNEDVARPRNYNTPIVRGNQVFVATANGSGIGGLGLLKLRADGDGVAAEQQYFLQRGVTPNPFTDSAVLVGDHVYLLCGGSSAPTCVELNTGQRIWQWRKDWAERGAWAFADRHLYLRRADGRVTLVEATPAEYIEKSSFTIPQPKSGATMPVIAGGHLYVRDDDRLLCYDVRGGALHRDRPEAVKINLGLPDSEVADKPRERTLRSVFVPTPQDVVEKMLALAKVKKSDLVYDLGSGDGRIVITAAKRYGSRAVGYEIDKDLVELSRENAAKAKVENLVTVHHEDLFKADLKAADVVAVYLLPKQLEKLLPEFEKLKPGARIVSHHFEIPGVKVEDVVEFESKDNYSKHKIYLWTVPLGRVKEEVK